MELPEETGPSWSLHAVPDGSQIRMPGIAIGQHPAHRNMRDWFDQEGVLSASRRKSCKGSLKKAAWPQGNNALVGVSCAIFILIMKGILLVFCNTELCFLSIYLILGLLSISSDGLTL